MRELKDAYTRVIVKINVKLCQNAMGNFNKRMDIFRVAVIIGIFHHKTKVLFILGKREELTNFTLDKCYTLMIFSREFGFAVKTMFYCALDISFFLH